MYIERNMYFSTFSKQHYRIQISLDLYKLPYLSDETQFEFCQTYDVITVCQRPAGDVHQVSLGDQDYQVSQEIRITR
jgi:hypothetical protein